MTPRPTTRCHRSIHREPCGVPFEHHDPITGACPGGTHRQHTFRQHVKSPTRAGQSFAEAEVELLASLLLGLTRGADLRVLARAPAFAGLAGKVLRMRDRLRAGQSTASTQQQQEDPHGTETASRLA